MAADRNLVIEIEVVDKNATKVLKQIDTTAEHMGQTLTGTATVGMGRLESAIMRATGTGLLFARFAEDVTRALFNWGKEAVFTAARTEGLVAVAQYLGRRNGETTASTNVLIEALKRQGITTQEAANTIIQLTRAQIPLTQATKLATVAQNAAFISGMNSSDALEQILHGIVTLQPRVIRQAGLVINLEQAYQAFAKTAHRSTEELTGAEKQQIALNAVLDAGERITGTYALSMEYVGKQLTSIPRFAQEAANAVGTQFLPALRVAVVGLTEFLKILTAHPAAFAMLIGGLVAYIAPAIAVKAASFAGMTAIAEFGATLAGPVGVALAAATVLTINFQNSIKGIKDIAEGTTGSIRALRDEYERLGVSFDKAKEEAERKKRQDSANGQGFLQPWQTRNDGKVGLLYTIEQGKLLASQLPTKPLSEFAFNLKGVAASADTAAEALAEIALANKKYQEDVAKGGQGLRLQVEHMDETGAKVNELAEHYGVAELSVTRLKKEVAESTRELERQSEAADKWWAGWEENLRQSSIKQEQGGVPDLALSWTQLTNIAQGLTSEGLIPMAAGFDLADSRMRGYWRDLDALKKTQEDFSDFINTPITVNGIPSGFGITWGANIDKPAKDTITTLEGLSDMFVKLGQVAGGSLGHIVFDVGQLLVTIEATKTFFGESEWNAKKWGAAVEIAATTAAAAMKAFQATSAISGAASGAQAGATIGNASGGAHGAVIGGVIGAAIGAISGAISHSFEMGKAHSQFAGLEYDAEKLGFTLDRTFRTKNLEGYTEEINHLQDIIKGINDSLDALQSAEDKWHFTATADAISLYQDYKLLVTAGYDQVDVLKRQKVSWQELVTNAMIYGTVLPNELKPLLQTLVDNGLLLDQNGRQLKNLAGINFGDIGSRAETAFDRMTKAVDRLVASLKIYLGLPLTQSEGASLGVYVAPSLPTTNTGNSSWTWGGAYGPDGMTDWYHMAPGGGYDRVVHQHDRPTGHFGGSVGMQQILHAGGEVDARLLTGEFVMQRAAVNKFGLGFMRDLNAGRLSPTGGGTTIVVGDVHVQLDGTEDETRLQYKVGRGIVRKMKDRGVRFR